MNALAETISNRIQELSRIISAAEADLRHTPDGSLRICKKKNTYQYYLRTEPKDTKGIYIKKKDMDLIRKLAQKNYAEKALTAACKERNELRVILKKYKEDKIEELYDKLSEPRQNLIRPYIVPDNQYISQWQKAGFSTFLDSKENSIYTEKGETVRSKSEKILADKFNIMGIPYHYEKPLHLKGFGIVHPDFVVLNKRTRQEYYWEHLGLMDDTDYCEKTIQKIESYAKNGILQGKNLILTYETSKHPLNMRVVERLIHAYLL